MNSNAFCTPFSPLDNKVQHENGEEQKQTEQKLLGLRWLKTSEYNSYFLGVVFYTARAMIRRYVWSSLILSGNYCGICMKMVFSFEQKHEQKMFSFYPRSIWFFFYVNFNSHFLSVWNGFQGLRKYI